MLIVQWLWCQVISTGANSWLLEMPTNDDTAEYIMAMSNLVKVCKCPYDEEKDTFLWLLIKVLLWIEAFSLSKFNFCHRSISMLIFGFDIPEINKSHGIPKKKFIQVAFIAITGCSSGYGKIHSVKCIYVKI